MKREVILFLILMGLIFVIVPFASADETSQINTAYSCLLDKINSTNCTQMSFEQQAFSLLAVNKCSDEVIKSNKTIASANSTANCWPSSSCDLKSTSLALLGLSQHRTDYNLSGGKSWILSNKIVSKDLDWFLEIEADGASACKLYYSGQENGVTLNIGSDRKLSSSNLGNCLSLAKNNYMLKVSPNCYNEEIDVQCTTGNSGFLTTLLFQKTDSTTLNVLNDVQSTSSGGTLTVKVNSWCLANPSSSTCNYEGTMWASQVLFALGEDVSPYLPYLVASSEDNSKYLPESTLYYLTGNQDFLTTLLSKQIASKYWSISGNRYYDTAFALLPLQYESPFEKTNAKTWLLKDQQSTGCWNNGNLRDTAFILYSIWPREFSSSGGICGNGIKESGEQCDGSDLNGVSCTSLGYDSGTLSCNAAGTLDECTFDERDCVVPPECTTKDDCPIGYGCTSGGDCIKESNGTNYCFSDSDCASNNCVNNICVDNQLDCLDSNYFCVSPIDCATGNTLSGYSCSSLFYTCCKTKKSYGTCSSNNGEICSSSQTCSGTSINADNLNSGEICCSGTCTDGNNNPDIATCETSGGGTCRTSCISGEKSTAFYTCDFSGDSCCVPETSKKGNYLWLWILIILILLIVLGIVFREKINDFIMKLKTKSKKHKPGEERRPLYGGLRPMNTNHPPSGRPVPRRILPPSHQPQNRVPPRPAPKKPTKTSEELEEVLRKLKDLGKK